MTVQFCHCLADSCDEEQIHLLGELSPSRDMDAQSSLKILSATLCCGGNVILQVESGCHRQGLGEGWRPVQICRLSNDADEGSSRRNMCVALKLYTYGIISCTPR